MNIKPVSQRAENDLRETFQSIEAQMGFLPNDALVMARRPKLLEGFRQLLIGLYSGMEIDRELAQLVGHIASAAAGCRYCQAHTIAGAEKRDIDPAKLDQLWAFEQSDLFSDAEKAALRLARDAAQSPSAATPEHFAELRRFYSEDEMVDIMAVISLFGFLNRWNDSLATILEPQPQAAAKKYLASHGWDVGKHG